MSDDLAIALEAASNNAGALETLLENQGNDAGATQADSAQRRLLFAAMEANAVDAMQKLGTTAASQQTLKTLTNNMAADTARLAQSEANLQKFVALGTAAVTLAASLVASPVNVIGGLGAVTAMLQVLGH
jgi:hypothetical protein